MVKQIYRSYSFSFRVGSGHVSLFIIDPEKSYVYVLKLRSKNKYYVGYSSDLAKRLESHVKEKGAEYTKKHGVERLVALVECSDSGRAKELESILTEYFISVYGKRNVRGAGHTDSRDIDESKEQQVASEVETQEAETTETPPDKPYSCEVCGRPIRHRGRCMACNIIAKREREAKGE
ncbi:MAG: hypothetical protein EAX95_16155 [Candidatus Thorarchaeota archaeon]|nr:hypothetical protein [Candidatus Thorarchaeota archaeon]